MRNILVPALVAVSMSSIPARADESPDPELQRSVQAGNQGWVDGLKAGDPAVIVAPYEEDALDCAGTGDCLKGRAAIEKHYAERIAKLGRATWGEVVTRQLVRDGDYAYEWGRAHAKFAGDKQIEGRYLTVWRRQKDGTWKIFRNLPLP